MNRQCFWEMFGGIALPGRKLGCLVLEIYNRVSLFIISNSILMDILNMIQICLRRKTIMRAMREIFFIHQTLARS